MNIIRSTAAYERWLRRQLHGNLIEKDLDEKHAKMAADDFQFLRATYWRWAETILTICPKLRSAPSVLAVGDIHIENFGSWRDHEGRLVWGVNDFDEAAKMPYVLDLLRLATSAVLAKAPGLSAARICTYILEGYREGLDDPKPFVLDRQHEWLRERVVVPEDERMKFWSKFDPEKNNRKSESKNAKRKIPHRYVAALESARPNARVELSYWPRSAGTGSLGRPRWIGYGLWQGAPVVREAKAIVPSAWTRVHGGSRRPRCAEIAEGKYRSPDPWYALKGDTLVRRLSPNNRKIELPAKKDQPDLGRFVRPSDLVNEKMLTAMGRDLAAIHLGSANRRKAITADFDGRERGWFLAAVTAAATLISEEQSQWKAALESLTGTTKK